MVRDVVSSLLLALRLPRYGYSYWFARMVRDTDPGVALLRRVLLAMDIRILDGSCIPADMRRRASIYFVPCRRVARLKTVFVLSVDLQPA